ncbi:MAG: DEAD/DEAH box helicase [Flavobacteriaceae bacterium]|nr:DEAD/DEAH box helicase [Flavobacteriaceae bacterium]
MSHLPEGKKINYLGVTFYNALNNYYNNYGDVEIDLDSLLVQNLGEVIQKDQIINDLKLFASEKLSQITGKDDIKNLSKNKLRKSLIKYYNIKYQKDLNIPNETTNLSECEFTLHDFQDRIRRKIINLIFQNKRRFLIHMPTGSGKTRTTGEIILDFIRLSSSKALLNDKMKILWISQTNELCFQAYETINWLFSKKGTRDISFGHFYQSKKLPYNIENTAAIIFCSIQQLLRHYKKPIWQKIRNDNYLVVVDEAHRSVANKWVKALNFFVANSSTYLLGLTATPGLGRREDEDNYSLSSYYNGIKISITDENYSEILNPIEHLVKRKFLAKIDRVDIDSYQELDDKTSLDKNNNFIFTKKTLKQLSESPSRNLSIANIIKDNYRLQKKILVFTCGIDHNRILQAILRGLCIDSETIDTYSRNRNTIINRFKEGNLNVLLNFGVLTTGFDAPKTDVCIIARPITSIVMYSQMVGRILRGPKNNGNKKNTLYTIKDNLNLGSYDNMFNSFNDFYK